MAKKKTTQLPPATASQMNDMHAVVQGGVSKAITTQLIIASATKKTEDYSTLQAITSQIAGEQVSVKCRTTDGDNGGGIFYWDETNLSDKVSGDPLMGIYVPPAAEPTGATGAWVRANITNGDSAWWGGSTVSFYVSTTGNNNNTGMAATSPLLTFQKAFDVLKLYGPVLQGAWEIVALDGTFSIPGGQQTFTTPSINRVIIRGAATGGHPAVPTAIIDGAGGGTYDHGLSASGGGVRVEFRDLKFINFNEASSAVTRIGCVGENQADVYWNNVHTDDCDWTGIYAFSTVRARISGGIHDGNTDGMIVNATEATIGYNGIGPIIRNSTQSGVYWSRGSQGHCDNCIIEDCAVGLRVAENSRVDAVTNNFKRNAYAIRTESGGMFGDSDTSIFNTGTADANTVEKDFRAYSGDTKELRFAYSEARVARDRNVYAHTGTLDETIISTPYTVPANRMIYAESKLRIFVSGTIGAIVNGAALILKIGGVDVDRLGFVGSPAIAGAFTANFDLWPNGATAQRFNSILQSSMATPRMGNGTGAIDFTVSQDIQIALELADIADTITISRIEVFRIA